MKKILAILLSVMMLACAIPVGAFEIDLPEAAVEATESVAPAELASLVLDDIKSTSYGTLIYFNDFESYDLATAPTSVVSKYDSGDAYVAGIFAKEDGPQVKFTATVGVATPSFDDSASSSTADGKFFKVKGPQNWYYGYVMFSNQQLGGKGTFTAVADYLVAAMTVDGGRFRYNFGSAQVVQNGWSNSSTGWFRDYPISAARGETGIGELNFGSYNYSGFYGLDNFRVYYQPAITYINSNDEEVYVDYDLGTGYAAYRPYCPTMEDGQIGWALEKDQMDPVNVLNYVAEDINLYPVFGDAYTATYYAPDGSIMFQETFPTSSTTYEVTYMPATDYIIAAPDLCKLKGWSLMPGGAAVTVVEDVDDDLAFFPVLEKVTDAYLDGFGILQYFNNFDHLEAGTTGYTERAGNSKAYFNPDGLFNEAVFQNIQGGVSKYSVVEGTNGNKFIRGSGSNGAGYAGFSMSGYKNGSGVTTVKFDYSHNDNSQSEVQLWVQGITAKFAISARSAFFTASYAYPQGTGITNSQFGIGSAWYWGGSTDHDNVGIYYAPVISYVDNEGVEINSRVVKDGLDAYYPDEPLSDVQVGGYDQIGWSTVENDVLPMKGITITGDTVFYPVYGDAVVVTYIDEKGLPLYSDIALRGENYTPDYKMNINYVDADGKVGKQIGWSLEKGGEPVSIIENVTEPINLYAAFETGVSTNHDQYGKLVYYTDFDNYGEGEIASSTNFTQDGTIAYFGGMLEGAKANWIAWQIGHRSDLTVKETQTLASKCLVVTGYGNPWVNAAVRFKNADNTDKTVTGYAGKFTITFALYSQSNSTDNYMISALTSPSQGLDSNPTTYYSPNSVYPRTFKLEALANQGLNGFGIYAEWMNQVGGTFEIDNFAIYYMPIVYYVDDDEQVIDEDYAGAVYTPNTINFLDDKEVLGVKYVQIGWATTPGSTVPETEIENVTEGTIFYPVWAEADDIVPLTYDAAEFRAAKGSVKAGLRFKATVTPAQRTAADEYGFIIGKAIDFSADENELTFVGATYDGGIGDAANGGKFVYGAAYDREDGTDIIYNTDASTGNVDYTGVVVDIPEEQYGTFLIARSYIRIGMNYYYGSSVTSTVNTAPGYINR